MLRMTSSCLETSGIWDNHHRGSIGNFIKERILQSSDLSFVSAYFTIYAYAALKDQLDQKFGTIEAKNEATNQVTNEVTPQVTPKYPPK
jgi:hypothetical protein